MAIQKNFVIKNGLEVDNNLIFADSDANKVGIGTTDLQHTLTVNGEIGVTDLTVSGIATISTLNADAAYINSGIATLSLLNTQNLNVSGIGTLNNIFLNGYVNIGGTTGKEGQILVSTGTGVSWSKLSKNSILVTAFAGQDTFYFNYDVGSVEVYVNGVRLAPTEYEAIDGATIVFNAPCFGDETVEILAAQTLPVATGGETIVAIGITVQDEGSTVGTANSITLLNFIGAGVTVTAAGTNGANITINAVSSPPGKTIYVAMNGSDTNDGLTLDYAKRTIEAAVGIASAGDTVKVSPGTYIENNPIVLNESVSIEGAELRNCIVTPQNADKDLFHVTNGTHLTDLSFIGPTATNGAAVVAFKPLDPVGVASNRFFDAARMIRYNLDFIASEAVGYITSTDYRSPAFTLSAGVSTVTSGVKNALRAICHDITRGGNSKCVGVGISQYTEYVGMSTEMIDTLYYSAGIAKSCINNVFWNGNYQSTNTQLRDLSIQGDGAYGNQNINSCANVVSAVYSCVGVVTTIIGQSPSVVGSSFNLMYPGLAGIGTTNPNTVPSQGVGVVTKGPYVRNCTNFIPNSIGMKVDGFNADPGDKDDAGITGMMSVDSYTQYNQGGIGVEISNGAYTQLVSIFTICDDKAIVTKSGGQCDITNSNSSFGTYGLVSEGIAGTTSKSSYRYTTNVSVGASEGDTTVVISGVGNERPYSGQVLYFGELYYEVQSIKIEDGGSGFTEPPIVLFLASPTGPSPIEADAFTTIENGKITSVNMIGNGRNYRKSDDIENNISYSGGGGSGASLVAVTRPLYYQVRSATPPSGGISTVTLAQPLNNNVGVGTTVFLFRQSLQIVSSHSFEYIGAGNTIEIARPSKGGVTVQANEVVKLDGGEIVYTSTDQDGNFAIGEDLVIDQATGTIRGRSFERSLLNTVTPFIIALGAK